MESSKYRENEKSRKKLLDKYNDYIGSKSVKNLDYQNY